MMPRGGNPWPCGGADDRAPLPKAFLASGPRFDRLRRSRMQPASSPCADTATMIPIKAKITLLIIVGIGLGTGGTIYGLVGLCLGISHSYLLTTAQEHILASLAFGGGLLAASVAALVAHLRGGFREVRDIEWSDAPDPARE